MSERFLLAALIAGIILPPAAAQAAAWDCRADAQGGWECTADDTATVPLPDPDPAATPQPTPALAPAAPAAVTSEPPTTLEVGPTPAPPAAAAEPAAIGTPAPGGPAADGNAAGPWALCEVRMQPELPAADLTATELSADQAQVREGSIYELTGNAVIERAGQRISADRIEYDEAQGKVQADGAVELDEAALRVSGSSATLFTQTDQGEIQNVRYEVYAQHARGEAASVTQESRTVHRFNEATYTTCDPGRERWRLRAKDVTLNEAEGVGRAHHVRLEVRDVPVLYTPYISFPIDDRRKSGFLVPSWGNSDTNGAEVTIPYYWNIAPHRDATITPRILTKRGVQIQSELRYLNPYNQGELDLEYLPSDSEYNDEDRALFTIDHRGNPFDRLHTRITAADVSDDQYFEDLGTSLEVSSITHLERRAEATYFSDSWSLTGRAQDYQTIDSTIPASSRPYRRLPQVLFTARPRIEPYGLQLSLNSELVQFDQDERETGTRLDLLPKVALPFGGAAWFVTPALGLRHTQYVLDNRTAGLPDELDRTTPIASLDSGLFFERGVSLFGNSLLQTLEPRAFYLYVPNKNQDQFPVFDSSERDFSFQQMFEDNRFSGADRMGDADQATVALTSRLLDPASGVQHASFSLGSIFYFRDREVTLPDTESEEQSASNLVGELDLRLSPSWKAIAGMQWDPFESKTERSSVRLQYRPDPRHLINFAYRFRSDELEQIDTSTLWYFTPRWHGVARWNYSLSDRELLEGLVGVEYESCCWILRLLGRSFVNDVGGERNDAVLVQLELKGLTSFGDPIENLLKDGILGYSRYQ